MSSDDAVTQHSVETSNESTDRGLFDFIKKDDHDESKVIATEFEQKVQVSEAEPKFEDCKVVQDEEEDKVTKPSLLQKLHRSGSSSSSSSSDEEVEEGGEKKKKKKEKKGLKEKIEEKIHHKEEDTSVPVEVVTEPEEKKGFMEKIKEKLPGGGKKVEEETVDCKVSKEDVPVSAPPVESVVEGGEPAAKKGIFEKIKEKIPGYHPKTSAEEEKKEKDCA